MRVLRVAQDDRMVRSFALLRTTGKTQDDNFYSNLKVRHLMLPPDFMYSDISRATVR